MGGIINSMRGQGEFIFIFRCRLVGNSLEPVCATCILVGNNREHFGVIAWGFRVDCEFRGSIFLGSAKGRGVILLLRG